MKKQAGLLAMITPVWFVGVYLFMSSLRPRYSHLTRAISELGTLDAPHGVYWNVLGYVLTGLAIAVLGLGMKNEFTPLARKSRWPACALMLSGLFMTLSGIFPGDLAHRTSLTTTMHLVGSFGSYVAFLVAGLWFPVYFRKNPGWRMFFWPSLILVVASLLTGVLRQGDMPGLGQRLTFACYFGWIFLAGLRLYKRNAARLPSHR